MSKPNKRHHELCQRYKQEGRRERNKKLRAEQHEKQMAKFARRRERAAQQKKPYKYTDPDERGDNRMQSSKLSPIRNKQEHMDEYSKMKSVLRRVQNKFDAENAERKRNESEFKKRDKESNNVE